MAEFSKPYADYGNLPLDDGKKAVEETYNNGGRPVEGGFGQGQLYGAQQGEMKIPFGTGMMNVSGETQDIHLEDTKKRLAKRANQIYRTLCDELEIRVCFFYGFSAWSEFVDGKISETRFYEAAKAEAQDVIAKSK